MLTFVLVFVGIFLWLQNELNNPPNTAPTKEFFFDVVRNQKPRKIIDTLGREGILRNPELLFWYGRITGDLSKIKAGDYRFTDQMSPKEVLDTLVSGISYAKPITIPEGMDLKQIASIFGSALPPETATIEMERFTALSHDFEFIKSLGIFSIPPPSLEGFLFPDTYLISRHTKAEILIHQMTKKYRSVVTEQHLESAHRMGFSELQYVTLASMVERETGDPRERPLIASVFLNRLQKGMRLQSDPTVIYGMKNYIGNISKKDLLTPSPYNTYTKGGLPIGPIANPGKGALEAVLAPAKSKYIYFVSHNDGTHEFTETYENHLEAVQKFQLNAKAREGHSWRELKQKQ